MGTEIEANIDVRGEHVDVAECEVADAGGRVAVVEKFAKVAAAAAHHAEPVAGDLAELAGAAVEPFLNLGITFDG